MSNMARGRDQAAGLRRLFAPPQPRWLPVMLATDEPGAGGWVATLARQFAGQGSRTLIVDAARAQVASAFGLRARYDLVHAFDGDCTPREACIPAAADIRILPAARALSYGRRGADAVARFEAGVRALAGAADWVLLVLPARQARVATLFRGGPAPADVLVALGPGADSERLAIEAIRSLSVVDIDAFRLLFQATGGDGAGSLLSRLAASGARQLRARVSAAGNVHDAAAIQRLVRELRCRGPRADGAPAGTAAAVETVF